MERLVGLAAACSAALLEDLTTTIRERHKSRPCATDDVRRGVDQALATKVREVALTGQGRSCGTLLHLHDVTRERVIDEMKTDFISLVSHELRTPLTSILGFSSYLLTGKLGTVTEVQKTALESVHRQAKRSRRLADAMVHEVPAESDPDTHADAQLIADQERAAHRARIDEALSHIAERYRVAIELRLIQELTREECAKRLGVTIGTFDVLLFRAVRAFRKHFGERAEGEPDGD